MLLFYVFLHGIERQQPFSKEVSFHTPKKHVKNVFLFIGKYLEEFIICLDRILFFTF